MGEQVLVKEAYVSFRHLLNCLVDSADGVDVRKLSAWDVERLQAAALTIARRFNAEAQR